MGVYARYKTLIFDLGDVLFSWSSRTETTISPVTLKKMLLSPTWFDYECGRTPQGLCYQRLGNQFGFEPAEVETAFAMARSSVRCNDELLSVIRQLKVESNGTLRVYAMSNISQPDYEFLRMQPVDWSIFDQVFVSCAVGERKPNLAFYQHVLDVTQADPQSTIFIDDKSENVLSARSFGLYGIIYDSTQQASRALRNLVGDPVKRGEAFLEKNSKRLGSTTDRGDNFDENFTQLLILEATGNRDLVVLEDHPRIWNFFKGEQVLYDLDTTAIGLTVMERDEGVVHSVLDEMMEYTNNDGIIQTYFDHNRPRLDPVVCVNVLSLFYSYGRGKQVIPTFQWVYKVLLNRAYLDGTRYYCTPECFLYFLSRFIEFSDSPEIHQQLKPLLLERVQERIGANSDSMALAMRILVCKALGVRDEVDARSLLPLQCEDGGWEPCWMFRLPVTMVKVGNRGLTTALAVNAIKAIMELPRCADTP